jgi:hypothetical protein
MVAVFDTKKVKIETKLWIMFLSDIPTVMTCMTSNGGAAF